MNDELYFCLYLTESEHWIVENDINKMCGYLNLRLCYYRELKEGHIPMFREIKISGNGTSIKRFKKYMRQEKYDEHIKENPYSKARKYLKSGKVVKSFNDLDEFNKEVQAGSSVLQVLKRAEDSLSGGQFYV